MSTTVTSLANYGDTKGRDSYLRNLVQVVKGSGTSVNTLTQGFYGIPSTTDEEYELARVVVAESSVDDEIGTFTVELRDGSTLNDVLSLNNTTSNINTSTLNLNATDVFASGTLDVSTIQQNAETLGSRVELVSDSADPVINFVLGNLTDVENSATTPLQVTQTAVAVTGDLTIDGTNVFEAITDGNPWTSTGTVTQLKGDYDNVEINVENAYSTSVALDVNGAVRFRGNDVYFYDEPNATFYSTLAYVESDGEVRLRASRAGDSIVMSTSSGADNTHLDRFTLDDGAGSVNATFKNVYLGIGSEPSGSYILDVTGNANFTTGITSGGSIDLSGNDLINVTSIQSSDEAAEQASIVLTSDDTTPTIDFVLGSATVASLSEDSGSFNKPTTFSDDVTISGNLNVTGTQVVLNTTTVEVEDISIEMGNSAANHAEINGGGVILGSSVADITIPSILYSQADVRWETSVGLHVPSTSTFTVGDSTEVTDGSLALKSDSGIVFFGGSKQWRLGIFSDDDGDHFQIAHDDDGSDTYVTKLDVLA